jgi:hypothetical protein
MTDLAGRAVFSEKMMVKTGQNKKEISVQNLPAGFYFVKVVNAGRKHIFRVIKD